MKDTHRINYLLTSYRRQTISESEQKELFLWVNASVANKALFEELQNPLAQQQALQKFDRYQAQSFRKPEEKKRKRISWIAYAAAAVLISGLTATFFIKTTRIHQPIATSLNSPKQPIIQDEAILTLANGEVITLKDSASNHTGIRIITLANGELEYQLEDIVTAVPQLNSISTSRGKQIHISLPDGSKIFLNSASTLSYSTNFLANNRQVSLSGEGHFEVKALKTEASKFTVHVNKETIEVLGTEFNIQAYPDDPSSKTSLLHGSIKLRTAHSELILKPGQQAEVFKENADQIILSSFNIQDFSDWKNGYFYFEDEHIESIMKKISRWYDMDIIYEGKVATDGFSGVVTKFSDVKELLNMLEETGKVKFKIQGRRIIVTS